MAGAPMGMTLPIWHYVIRSSSRNGIFCAERAGSLQMNPVGREWFDIDDRVMVQIMLRR